MLLIGDSDVGKTGLLVRYADDTFNDVTFPTIGIDFRIKTIRIGDATVKLKIWDTCTYTIKCYNTII